MVWAQPVNLSDVVLDEWLETLRGPQWTALRDIAARSCPEFGCYWELHPSGERVDLCHVATIAEPRERKRLLRWLEAHAADHGPRGFAARALRPWVEAPEGVNMIGWEEDAGEREGVGTFANIDHRERTADTIARAHKAFDLPKAIVARSNLLFESIEHAVRIVAVGRFFGREAPPELRLILRSTREDWLEHLPESIQQEVKELCAALPAGTHTNLALSVQADDIYLALESRFSEERVSNAAWAPWLERMLPSPSPLHNQLIEALIAQTGPFLPKRWPAKVLIDAFLQAEAHVPVLEAYFSHVKVRRRRDGTLERKLYLLFEQRWRQLG